MDASKHYSVLSFKLGPWMEHASPHGIVLALTANGYFVQTSDRFILYITNGAQTRFNYSWHGSDIISSVVGGYDSNPWLVVLMADGALVCVHSTTSYRKIFTSETAESLRVAHGMYGVTLTAARDCDEICVFMVVDHIKPGIWYNFVESTATPIPVSAGCVNTFNKNTLCILGPSDETLTLVVAGVPAASVQLQMPPSCFGSWKNVTAFGNDQFAVVATRGILVYVNQMLTACIEIVAPFNCVWAATHLVVCTAIGRVITIEPDFTCTTVANFSPNIMQAFIHNTNASAIYYTGPYAIHGWRIQLLPDDFFVQFKQLMHTALDIGECSNKLKHQRKEDVTASSSNCDDPD